ncbi:hypothetical protein LCE44_28185, partial [Vibrio harveyi]
ANRTKLVGAEKLYNLLVHLYDVEGIESRLFEDGSEAEPGILYMIEDQIEHGFNHIHTNEIHSIIYILIVCVRLRCEYFYIR